MDPARISELRAWLIEAGLAGESETALLDGVCRRLPEAGLPIARAVMLIDTLHPVYEGRAFFLAPESGEQQTDWSNTVRATKARWRRPGGAACFFTCSRPRDRWSGCVFHAGETTDFPTIAPDARRRDERCRRDHHALCRVAGDRRDGFAVLLLGDGPSAGLRRRACRGFVALDADAGAGGQMRLAGPYRGHAGRDLSRPRRRPARAERADPARCRRPDQRRAVVQRPARIHPHHGSRRAGADHPAAQRLCRGGDLRDLR